MSLSVKPHGGGVRVDMDPDEAHEMACYFHRLSVDRNPADIAKDDMLAIIRLAHSQDPECCDGVADCPEPVAP